MNANKIYVGNIPYSTDENAVRDFFAPCGEIEEIILIKDKFTNQLKGFGFITFKAQTSAQEALKMDGQQFEDKKLKVSIAREKDDTKRKPYANRRW